MPLPRQEAYQNAFGITPDQLLVSYENCTPEDWAPTTHFQVRIAGSGAEAEQQVIFYSSFRHSYISGNPVFYEARKASKYVAAHAPDLDMLAVNVEGRVRNPPDISVDTFAEYGEIGTFERGLREQGVKDKSIKSPEPSKEVIHGIAQEVGELDTLTCFILRKLPQTLEASGPSAHPFTELWMLAHEQAQVTGLPPIANPARKLSEIWNDQHPSELHIAPGRVAPPALINALRRETTFEAFKVAEEDRNSIQRAAGFLTLERQLGFAATLASDLAQGKHPVFGVGRAHALALSRWLVRRTDSDGYVSL